MSQCKRKPIKCGKNGVIYWCDSHFRLNKLRNILQKFLKEFAKISMMFARNDCLLDFPFASFYNEGTLASVLMPALRGIAKSQYVMAEVPIGRRNQNIAFIDYVVCTDVGFLLIEVKFPLNRFYREVNKGLDQIIRINPSICQYYDPAYRILLVIKPLFTNCDNNINVESECCYYCKSFSDIVKQRTRSLADQNKKSPKFCAHWRIPNYIKYKIEDECYPAVLFYGTILVG